jgi:UDP-glucose 4-epimerase
MKGILVTFVSAPPGLELCRALAPHMPVLACGPEPEAAVAPLLGAGVRYLATDLAHSRNRCALLFGPALDAGVEAVVHAPCCDAHRPHLAADVLRELLHLCERHPTIRRFLYRSTTEVYRIGAGDPALIDEEHPVEASALAPLSLHDLVEADQSACAHIGTSRLRVAVLRSAELFAPGADGPLRRWLRSQPCLRPLGFDPVVNLISGEDLVRAISLALREQVSGVFNVAGADLLPLSALAAKAERRCVAAPDPIASAWYRVRSLTGPAFDYRTNGPRLHFGGVPCGLSALAAFGYQPRTPIRWSAPLPSAEGVSSDAPDPAGRKSPIRRRSVLEARA